jgi:hypothetical protein
MTATCQRGSLGVNVFAKICAPGPAKEYCMARVVKEVMHDTWQYNDTDTRKCTCSMRWMGDLRYIEKGLVGPFTSKRYKM